MPQREDLPLITGDLNELKREINAAIDEIEAITDRRSNVAADKAAVVKRLEAKGVNRDAFRLALVYAGWSERKRQNFDVAYALVREARGLPVQGSLDFTAKAASTPKPKMAAVS